MADYTLSAKVTADASGFESGMGKASSAMEEFQGKCRKATASASTDVEGSSSRVSGAWASLRGKASAVWQGMGSAVGSVASSIDGRLGGALSKAAGLAEGVFNRIRGAASDALGGIQGMAERLGPALSGAFSGLSVAAVAGVGTAVTTVMSLTSAAVASYSSYEQLAGGVEKLYGDAAGQVKAFADQAYQSSGMSANQYMEQATAFSASLIKSLGGDTAAAARQTDVAMRAMSDNVNVFGSNMQDVQNAYQGFAKQNYTMLDNLKLGYSGTKEGMQKLIADANEYGRATGQASDLTIDSFSDIVTAIDLIQQKQGIAGTTAREAASTIEGSVNMAKSAWENWVAGFAKDGADMATLTDQLVGSIATAAGNIVPRFAQAMGAVVQTLPDVFGRAASWIAANAPQMLADAVATIGNSVGAALSEGLGIELPTIDAGELAASLSGALSAVVGFADSARSALSGIAGGLSEALSGVVGPMVATLGPYLDALVSGLQVAMSGIGEVASNLGATFQPVADAAMGAFQGVADAVTNSVLPALQQLQPVFEVLVGVVSGAVGPALQALADIVSVGLSTAFSVAGAVVTGAMQAISGVVQAVVGVLTAILGVFVGVFTGDWQIAADGASSVMTGMSSIVTGIMNGLSGAIGGILSGIAGLFSSVLNGITGTVSGIFSGIASTISGKIGDAKSTVQSGLNAISGFFSGLHLEFPHIKLPHFSISGSFSLMPPSVPSFGISWYAKGGVFSRPTIFAGAGVGVGEAGPEVVAPVDSLTGFIRDALGDGRDDELVAEVRALREYVGRLRIYLDKKELVGGIADEMDAELGRIGALA